MKGVIQPTKEKIERSNPRNLWSGNYYFPPTIKWLNLSSSQKIPFGQWIDLTTALTRNQNSLEQNFVDKYGSCFLGMISHEHFFFCSVLDHQSSFSLAFPINNPHVKWKGAHPSIQLLLVPILLILDLPCRIHHYYYCTKVRDGHVQRLCNLENFRKH